MPVYDARNKAEYERASMEAKAQERVVNKLYIAYHEKAVVVAKMFEENGNEAFKRGEPEYKVWTKALAEKQAAHNEWQREAHRHGAMYVELKRPENTGPKEHTVW